MKILIVALMVSMLLLAGCPGASSGTQGSTGSAEEGAGGSQQGTTGSAGTTSGAATSGSSAGAGTSGAGTGTSTETQGGTSGSTGGSDPFATWDMQAMIALGQPVYCEVSYSSEGVSGTQKMYLKGENMRVEYSSTAGGQTMETVTIMKGKMVYTQTTPKMQVGTTTCDWASMDMDRIQQCAPPDAEGQQAGVAQYNDTPSQYNCNYGTFGDEKFTVPAVPAECDLSEQLCAAYEMSQGLAACEGLEGEALQACYEAAFGTGG